MSPRMTQTTTNTVHATMKTIAIMRHRVIICLSQYFSNEIMFGSSFGVSGSWVRRKISPCFDQDNIFSFLLCLFLISSLSALIMFDNLYMNNQSLVDSTFSVLGFSVVISPKKSIFPVNLRSLVAVKFFLIVSLFSSILCLISSNIL